jgi:hypothetical protein
MARTTGVGVNRRNADSRPVKHTRLQVRRAATPNSELLVIKVGERYQKLKVPPNERASGILARIAKAIAKPGADRTRVFQSASSKPVYAYSIYSKDTSKVIREDASGHQTVGRFVSGRFRPISSARAV